MSHSNRQLTPMGIALYVLAFPPFALVVMAFAQWAYPAMSPANQHILDNGSGGAAVGIVLGMIGVPFLVGTCLGIKDLWGAFRSRLATAP